MALVFSVKFGRYTSVGPCVLSVTRGGREQTCLHASESLCQLQCDSYQPLPWLSGMQRLVVFHRHPMARFDCAISLAWESTGLPFTLFDAVQLKWNHKVSLIKSSVTTKRVQAQALFSQQAILRSK